MKISILGYSGSGKSTLAQRLAEAYGIPVLHFDTVQFLPGWEVRDAAEKEQITQEFLDTHDSWVIDGNYSRLFFDRRMAESDTIVLMRFNRFSCLLRAFRRFNRYKNTTRPDMAEGCPEKFDWEFAKWILWEGRSKRMRNLYNSLIAQYPGKMVLIRNQKQLDAYIRKVTVK